MQKQQLKPRSRAKQSFKWEISSSSLQCTTLPSGVAAPRDGSAGDCGCGEISRAQPRRKTQLRAS